MDLKALARQACVLLWYLLSLQNALTNKLPFCYANLLGTHNSGITLADGYGTLDPYFQKYFEWIKFAVSGMFTE